MEHERLERFGVGALSGFVAVCVALGIGEFAAGLVGDWRSPVEAVAETVIDNAPKPITRFGIETFGDNDKPALIVGILVVLAVVGVIIGVVSRRHPRIAVAIFGVFALVGAAASQQVYGATLAAIIPSLAAGAAGATTLLALRRLALSPPPLAETSAPANKLADAPDSTGASAIDRAGWGDRRAFLGLAAGLAGIAAVGAAGGRALRERFSAVASRAALVLPAAIRTPGPVPAGVEAGIEGMRPFVTPNADFYRVDTALVVPQVRAEDWQLRIHGMVDQELRLDFDELCQRGLIEADITMTCVSNQLNGDLIGHARWSGVPLRQLLDEVGVDPAADQLVGRSVDGYTCGFPVEAAGDRTALVAVGMNGEPLPLIHGFPARLITPGLYGYIGSTKWLTEIELTTFADFDQYWVPRGYADRAPIKTMTRIDVPRSGTIVPPGPAMIAGTAWAQTRGISQVEVKIDDADWRVADLADELNVESWRQWRFPWDATPGARRVSVRATDGNGQLQTDERRPILPDGASGWVTQLITVAAGDT
jgi:DMSO/TMAO reductase YedYZ molybdopterin-dependent catalytic subunit